MVVPAQRRTATSCSLEREVMATTATDPSSAIAPRIAAMTRVYGHIIDLPKTKIGVDVNNDFKPSYNTIKGKGEVIKQLKEASKKADKIYLASDPDREGESIAWHIANTLKLDHNEKNRIEFHEITEKAIKDAVKNPRKINISRVNSQQVEEF